MHIPGIRIIIHNILYNGYRSITLLITCWISLIERTTIMHTPFRKSLVIIPLLLGAIYGAHYYFLATGAEFTECITDNYCLSSRDDIFTLALVYTVTRALMLAAAFGALAGTVYIMRNRYFFLFGGMLCFAISAMSFFVLFKLTPAGELNNYIHIMVIAAFVAILGGLFIYAQFKK